MQKDLEIPAFKVNQWLEDWDKVPFSEESGKFRRKPENCFYVFSIKAIYLKRLSKIYRRTEDTRRAEQPEIQRKHDKERSEEIARFLKDGFPLSDINSAYDSPDREKYRMPGWLPTSVVANILLPGTKKKNEEINEEDCISVIHKKDMFFLRLPENVKDPSWLPDIAPIEIIDGQHRLLSFDEKDPSLAKYELPVVAFINLDITWQAYLFYTINIKPKRINKSLAFDLYPLLRTADWLEGSLSEKSVYKEIRAQEIVEVLWAYEKGFWYRQINLLGETGTKSNITQASFVRNITSTFFKSSGLFLGKMPDYGTPIGWDRVQQSAFILYLWEKIFSEIINRKPMWFKEIMRAVSPLLNEAIDSMSGESLKEILFNKYCLLTTDQGVRGFLSVIHDLILEGLEAAILRNLFTEDQRKKVDEIISLSLVEEAISELKDNIELNTFVEKICEVVCEFEWRTSSFPELPNEIQKNQRLFKGSGGYKDLKEQLLEKIITDGDEELKRIASKLSPR